MCVHFNRNTKKLRQNAFFQTKSIQNQLKETEWTTTTFKNNYYNNKKNITNKPNRIKWGRTKKKLTKECYPLSETRKEIFI